jgi:RNA polymerase sigma-70 factor (ECF subfamily)
MNSPQPAPISKQADPDSFRDIYQEYHGYVYRRAYSMLGDPSAAEDVTQNTFIQVYRNLPRYRGGVFRIWLFRIATNACYDELRRRKRHARLRPVSIDAHASGNNQLENLMSPDLTTEEAFEQLERSAEIQCCLNIMPQTHRSPLVLVDMLEMDYSEAAAYLGIPIGTLKSRLWRARSQLRALLDANQDFIDVSHGRYARSST